VGSLPIVALRGLLALLALRGLRRLEALQEARRAEARELAVERALAQLRRVPGERELLRATVDFGAAFAVVLLAHRAPLPAAGAAIVISAVLLVLGHPRRDVLTGAALALGALVITALTGSIDWYELGRLAGSAFGLAACVLGLALLPRARAQLGRHAGALRLLGALLVAFTVLQAVRIAVLAPDALGLYGAPSAVVAGLGAPAALVAVAGAFAATRRPARRDGPAAAPSPG
jgi:hypothetical protein